MKTSGVNFGMKAITFHSWDKMHVYKHISQCKRKAQTGEIDRDKSFFFFNQIGLQYGVTQADNSLIQNAVILKLQTFHN